MARNIGKERDITKALNAADEWKHRCLVGDGSVFSDELLWTSDNFAQLKVAFVDNPDEGKRSFYEKLEDQLAGYSPQVIKVAAEAIWVLLLFHSGIGAETKRRNFLRVWDWSDAAPPIEDRALEDAALIGVGNPGTAYTTQMWREFEFFIALIISFKQLGPEKRQEKLADPWVFEEWQSSVSGYASRQFVHMLNFWCFPDSFERITTASHKRLIAKVYGSFSEPEVEALSLVQLDQMLLEIRQRLETERQIEDFDFYMPDIRSEWAPEPTQKSTKKNTTIL
ncbi:hypothetical protein [Sneathiella sp.]|uniref:hypothetical protein n=1 Tax=Sneathiella sp. TaxID=1964365 RepID=UPI003565EFF3